MKDFTFTYDEATRVGTIRISKSGEELKISNISREQAEKWEKENAVEFVKRGFRMHTPSIDMTREDGGNG